MAEALRHQCTSCGGDLIFDSEAKLYKCPFCGVTYDYDVLESEDILSSGLAALRNGEFSSAKEIFDKVLEKDPHNFRALRGRVMVKARMKTIRVFENENKVAAINYGNIHIEEEASAALPENKKYFDKLKKMFELGEKYQKAVREERTAKTYEADAVEVLEQVETTGTVPMIFEWIGRFEKNAAFVILGAIGLFFFGIFLGTEDDGLLNIIYPIIRAAPFVMLVGLILVCVKHYRDLHAEKAIVKDRTTELKRATNQKEIVWDEICKNYRQLRTIDPERGVLS